MVDACAAADRTNVHVSDGDEHVVDANGDCFLRSARGVLSLGLGEALPDFPRFPQNQAL